MEKTSNKTRLVKFILPILSGSILPIAMLSAKCQTKEYLDDLTITKHSFKNYNPEFNVKEKADLKAYWKNEEMYVDVDEFLSTLEGFIDNSKFTTKIDLNKKEKSYILKGSTLGNEGESETQPDALVINWEKNTISVPNTWFFYSIIKPQQLTDGNQFLKSEYEQKIDATGDVVFDLGKYNMDILFKENKVLVPFSVFNTLFVTQNYNNIYFNGKTFTNLEAGIDSYSSFGTPKEAKLRIQKDATIAKKKPTKRQREINFHHLSFVMDYFYGLKRYKKFDSFEKYIGEDYKKKFLSTNPEEFHQAYIDVFHKKLNELHTRIDSLSYYNGYTEESLRNSKLAKDSKKYYGDYYNEFFKTQGELQDNFKKTFKKDLDKLELDDHIRFVGDDTAILSTFGFADATKDQIADKNNTWRYDTYFLMKNLMEKIKAKKEIKNIILDLSLNGGGSVQAMIRTLGFLTNNKVVNREYDVLNKIGSKTLSQVDVFGDNKFTKHNYDKYKWTALVGINTFSAANQATSIIKEMGIAKIIGQKSGGGMSAVIPATLLDGTTITMSSPNNATYGEKYDDIEGGIEPYVKLDYKDFYDNEKVKQAALEAHKIKQK
ncbi:S41 family peptidase [Metamycoplasma auris]|uniref:Peptidase S41-like protein n=1 Tax=Metamycoplasma auris TaxID=51363 RepID=A0A2W7G919_9BACT|nr:S41 family peptidase [Metamycoplasma auris]PZW01545.1 peptidase S41-like protein [Metamycoplasma auris]